jgi:acetylornithine deacetylase/succinyl-diaminopimelate desuccinylase-like protein
MAENPVNILARMISAMQNKKGQITIPGFYDRVHEPGSYERAFMKQQGPSDQSLLRSADLDEAAREEGYSLYEQTTIRPAIIVSGISAGHAGAGVKNIIPATATATINMRLVNDQDPVAIARSFAEYVIKQVPRQCRCTVRFSALSRPVEISRTHPYMNAVARAYTANFPFPPVFLRSGGTIPVVGLLSQELRIPVILMGFALASDNLHAANEKFSLQTLYRGINTSIAFMKNLSDSSTFLYGINNN